MPKLETKLRSISELNTINDALVPLKKLADKELASIYGLTGKVYTPHLDTYMQAAIEKSAILACLKRQKLISVSEVEVINETLDFLHKSVKNKAVVEYNGNSYERRFTPLKLSKSGKSVQKWAKFWLLHTANGNVDPFWESEVREIWPTYFLIRTVEM